jgi:hypothetical protein
MISNIVTTKTGWFLTYLTLFQLSSAEGDMIITGEEAKI